MRENRFFEGSTLIVLHEYTGSETPTVTFDGIALQAGVDYFATYLPDSHDLWLTLKKHLNGIRALSISN